MPNGFSFKGIHSDIYSLIMRSRKRQALPAAADVYKEVLGMPGSHLWAGKPQDRIEEVELTYIAESTQSLHEKIHEVAAWLYSDNREPLIYDSEPDLLYRAKITDSIETETQGLICNFKVKFRCEPWAYSAQVEQTFEINSPQDIVVNNDCLVEISPIIEISGGFTSLEIGDLEVNQPHSEGTILIDCDKYIIKKGLESILPATNGQFLTLQPGQNIIAISGIDLNCVLNFKFRLRHR